MNNTTAVLEKPVLRQDSSSMDEAIQECCEEIERRGRILIGNGDGLSNKEFWAYAGLASDIGYNRMRSIGNEILNRGGTFPALTVLSVTKHNERLVIYAMEDATNKEFTIPCKNPLKQYTGSPIKELDALQAYVGGKATIDVLKNKCGCEAVMIGRASQVLSDAPQAIRLDLIR